MSQAAVRVLQIGKFYPPHMGGIETHLEALCSELRRVLGVRVLAASDDRRRHDEVQQGVPVTRLGTLFHITSAPVCPGLAAEIRQARPDLVHIHLPHPAGVLSLLTSGYRGPLVVTYHSDVIRQRIMSGVFRPILDLALSRAVTVLASSAAYVESSAVLRDFRGRCRVVPFGIALDRFRHPDDRAVAGVRARFGPRIVLAVGRFIYYKGLQYAIRAMADVDARLVIVGDGPLRRALEQEAERCGVGGRVSFAGEVDDIVPYFHAADAFVLPSIARSEAFGIVQLEAMACGTPVINTAVDSGVPWVSRDGETGLTVAPADADALANAVNRLLADEALRARYGAAGRRRVEEEFTLERMVERTLAVYDEALGTGSDLAARYRMLRGSAISEAAGVSQG